MAGQERTTLFTCMRDEGPYLLDWVAHHRAAGFRDIFVASHDCADGTDRMLDALDRAGLVRHRPFRPSGRKTVQWQALDLLWPELAGAEWAAFLDCDEFLNLKADGRIETLIGALPEGTEACAMAWRLFGADPDGGIPDGPPTRLTACAPEDLAAPLGHFVKSLFRPAAFDGPGVHRPKGIARWADGSGRVLAPEWAERPGRINLFGLTGKSDFVQVDHHAVRSAGAFLLKRERGLPNRASRDVDLGYWVERNWTCAQDGSIARMAAAAEAERTALDALPGLREMHEAALAHHRARLDAILATEDGARLHWRLTLAGGSVPPAQDVARAHLKRLGALRDAA